MYKRMRSTLFLTVLSFLLFACAGGEKMDLEVKVALDGKPVSGAKVNVDGIETGATGADGVLVKQLIKNPGAEVEVTVVKELPGYRIKPWKNTFVMKLPKQDTVDKYAVTAELDFVRVVTIAALEKSAPIPDAVVTVGGKEAGKTGANGELVYEYRDLPNGILDLAVAKTGYSAWRKSMPVEAGQRIEVSLAKRMLVTVTALMEEYGQASGIPGLSVSVDKKVVGSTNAKGVVTWAYDGEPGKKVSLIIRAPGYIPEQWKTTFTLEGDFGVQRYFTPTSPRPIRTGIYRFVGNTPNVDLKDVLTQAEESMGAQLFRFGCFKAVPPQTLQADMKAAKVSVEKITAKGWRETSLRKTVDMIVLGSVAKDERGFLIETKFIASNGKTIHSQIARAKSEKDIGTATKDIANAVLAKFPFEGTVVGVEDDHYRINLGKAAYRIAKYTDFTLTTPRTDETGKVVGYREAGRLRVMKVDDNVSFAEVDTLKKGERVALGDRVVRLAVRDEEGADRAVTVLSTKGGLPPEVSPLAGVNIYLNDEWAGTTGSDGKAEIALRPGRTYDLVLYRHGYQQAGGKLKVEKSGEVREYSLAANNALFRIDSQPSGADVFVDGDRIGRTPILDGKPVTLGFHTVRVSAGGDYRDWEEVVEFASKTEDRTGNKAVVLYKDFLKVGERAEQQGNLDAAIAAYQSTEKGHPDYSAAHHRVAQIYLDDKGDYDGAIREFEKVLTLPENQQLVYKQYAVAFTNLGHAYYEKGNSLVQKDRDAAAQNFAKAVQNFQIAKQNTRFFPNDRYDEAVHDTYYYTALSYHKLYLLTKKPVVLSSANVAWREYFDFFPKNLEGNSAFEQNREAAQKYWDQVKNKQ
jgi:hypothetical protein